MSGYFLDVFLGNSSTISSEDAEVIFEDSAALSIEAMADSAVLLQNEDDTLPLDDSITKVNVFGWASTQWLGGGSGSGGVARVQTDLLTALEEYGISYNEELTAMYQDFHGAREYAALSSYPEQSGELYEPSINDEDYYSKELLENALAYSDTALVVFGRWNGESNDASMQQYKQTRKDGEIIVDSERTQLDLSTEEEELLAYVAANYENVIVLLNTGNVMTLEQIETIDGVDACVLTGLTGTYGAEAIPKLLWGEESFSGKTADTWAYDFSTAASYANSGSIGVGSYTNAEGLYPANGTNNGNVGASVEYTQVSYVDYAEGIYVGYKWYETADAEGFWNNVSNEYGEGYEGVVQYPFGYGLSYTSFDWEVVDAPVDGTAITDADTVSITVKVTNTGDYEGRDVVELYATPPYYKGEIEKASVNLIAYEKTSVLAVGESEEIVLTFDVADIASYDAYDANNNGFVGYELDAGEYIFSLRTDAHTLKDCENAEIVCTVEEGIILPVDTDTGNEVSNKFTGEDAVDGYSLDGGEQGIVYLSRADFAGTFPAESVSSREMPDAVAALNLYTEEMAQDWIDETDEEIRVGENNGLKLTENGVLTELGYTLGKDYENEQWEALLDQMTVEEMENLVYHGYAHTNAADSVGKNMTVEQDGPSQAGGFYGNTSTTGFPSSSTLACSWDQDLMYRIGQAQGKECQTQGINGWYAPAVNIHRSPFNGRNYEYYSEDAYLSGTACGNVVAGAKDMGVYCFVKHFVCNDGEAYIYRDSVYTWMTEQTLREIYLEPFRILVEDYDATGIMSSYNRLGAVWAGGSEALLTGILRDEWGFEGAVITDYSDHHEYMNGDQMLRAGGDLWMDGFNSGSASVETSSNSYQQALRRASKNILYMYANALAVNQDYVETHPDGVLASTGITNSLADTVRLAVNCLAALLMVLAVLGIVKDIRYKK
ncbi:MAG: glycoside hydrolase family 3 C-terminal domain-containing protein [Lachnospiraceae bacterium]|nr:glycoside hydrolase family 3 C-terminal domain-containing protein [Lachnospiraceae bacterium]